MTATSTTATRRPSRRAAKIAAVLAVPAAIAVSGLVVSQASYSAYSATTESPTSNWATGTVALSDDDRGIAEMTASNVKPGFTGSHCITVTSTGSLASAVKLYATGSASTKGLAEHIDVTLVQGTGGSFGNCSGFTRLPTGGTLFVGTMDGFSQSHTGFANGLGGWTPTGQGDESRTYMVTFRVDPEAPNTTQGGTASVGLTWEAQNS
ncbi:hypothetical protein GCM10009616_37490 [Microlunatus lacustris]